MNTIEFDPSMKTFIQPHIYEFLDLLDDAVADLPGYVIPLPNQALKLVAHHATGEDFSNKHESEAIAALGMPYEAGLTIIASINGDRSSLAYCEETELRIKNACN